MRSKLMVVILAVALAALLAVGCTDKTKDNPTRPATPDKGLVFQNDFNTFSVFFSTSGDHGDKPYRAYTPPGYLDLGNDTRYPVLFLLPPFQGDERFYFEHGLAEVANRLIDEGKIIPMIIVTIDGRSDLGGSFYVDSPRQGRYFTALYRDTTYIEKTSTGGLGPPVNIDYIANSFLSRIINNTYRTVQDPKFRAISGIGMGGYGAFRSALMTDNFGSVSAVNAPLDFDGTGSNGFLTLLNDVYAQTGGNWAEVDTSGSNPGMSLVISAASAFSPLDQDFTVDSVYYTIGEQILVFHYTVTDSLTADTSSLVRSHRVLVPFNHSGALNSSIWNIWLDNSIPSLYNTAPAPRSAAFATMKKLLIKSDDANFRYDQQMNGFINFANANNIAYQEMDFAGNGTLPATASNYLYDLFEDILIFHSNIFKEEMGK